MMRGDLRYRDSFIGHDIYCRDERHGGYRIRSFGPLPRRSDAAFRWA